MILAEAIAKARVYAKEARVDPSLPIAEAYLAELLRKLQVTLRGEVVWKGGAVLRMEGSERFSRDLDGTRRAGARSSARMSTALRNAGKGLPFLQDTEVRQRRRTLLAAYRFQIDGLRHPLRIVVEVSLRERILAPVTTVSTARLTQRGGTEPAIVLRLGTPELLAEKVRALVMRGAGRDIFDVYWLLQRGAEFDAKLFLGKMRYYARAGARVDAASAIEGAIQRLERSNPSAARLEIANLFPMAQRKIDFGVVLEDVITALREWLVSLRPKSPPKLRPRGPTGSGRGVR